MSNLPVSPQTATAATDEPKKLDDVLLAMDVVDTLRHRTRIAAQELNAEEREAELVARLKEIYHAQGIEVPDRILKDGVKALDEQRFVYQPPKDSFQVKMARAYVNRQRWFPQTVLGVGAVAAAVAGWQVFWAMPRAAEWNAMPAEIARMSDEAQALSDDPGVDARIAAIERAGSQAVEDRVRAEAKQQLAALESIKTQLAQEYDVRIRLDDEGSVGFYRATEDNPLGRSYYLVVEAVTPGGGTASVPIVSAETGQTENVTRWAQRVDKTVFDRVAAERENTGLIENDLLGRKPRGQLEPQWDVATPGGAITQW